MELEVAQLAGAESVNGRPSAARAFYAFPREHWPELRSTNPLERVTEEIGRRSDASGSTPTTARWRASPACS